jgi:hypothetical protein
MLLEIIGKDGKVIHAAFFDNLIDALEEQERLCSFMKDIKEIRVTA